MKNRLSAEPAPAAGPSADGSNTQTQTNGPPPNVPDHQLLHIIGQGSYGEVWLARNVMGEFRAVKLVHRAAFGGDTRPFEREFEGIRKFEPISRSHESQLPILHVGLNDAAGCFYYVMELADCAGGEREKEGERGNDTPAPDDRREAGTSVSPAPFPPFSPANYIPRTLRLELERHGRLPLAQCLDIGLALTTALAHLHKHGLVHRDIKPSNIIFVQGRPKLADIGLVTDVGDERSIVGTEGYLAPEGPGSPQADLYSLGKVLYEISTGRDRRHFPDLPLDLVPGSARVLPLLGERAGVRAGTSSNSLPGNEDDRRLGEEPPTSQSAIGNPKSAIAQGLLELNEILLKACARDPRQRYQSAEAMRADLALLQGGQSVKRKRAWEYWRAMGRKVSLVSAVLVVLAALGWKLLHDFELSRRGKQSALGANLPPMTGTTNLEAWKLYVRGNVCFRQFTIEGEKAARALLTEAVRLDPNFVLAHNYLFAGYVNSAALPYDEAVAGMRGMARKLREVNPNSAEAHYAQAYVDFRLDLKFAEAERGFESALQIDPSANARSFYGCYLVYVGRPDAAREQFRRMIDFDPASPVGESLFGCSYYAERNFAEAIVHFRRALELAPGYLYQHTLMGRTHEAMGDYLGALDHFQMMELGMGRSAEELKPKYAALRQAVQQSGAAGYWRTRLERAQRRSNPEAQPYELASSLAQLGRKAEALDWLEKAYARRDSMDRLLFDHYWDGLRDEPRFEALLKRMHFVR
jgi:serine/threonine protein kinase/Tfp pilus assembly protein PilF